MKKMVYFWLATLLSCFQMLYAGSLSIPQGVVVEAGLNAEFIAKFALFIAVLILWTVACGKLLERVLRLPVIAGQIIAGILLGPSGINIAAFDFFAEPVEMIDRATGNLYALASSDLFLFFVLLLSSSFTVGYFLWIAGHETDIKEILKVGVSAVSAGVLGALVPIGMTVIVAQWFFGPDFNLLSSIGLGLVFAATSVSIPVAMLFAQNKMHLKSSKAMLGAAIIDDIFAVLLLSLFFIVVDMGAFGSTVGLVMVAHRTGLVKALVYLLLAFGVIFFAGYYGIRPIITWLHNKRLSHLVAPVANGFMFFYFALAELFGGVAGITGAYFAGLFHRMGDTRYHAEKTISPFINAVLLPIFLCSIGLQVDIRLLAASQWIIVVTLLSVAVISKLMGCFMATGLGNLLQRSGDRWSALESYLFGSSMVARGEVGLVVATILNGAKVIMPQQYVIAVIVIVLTTIVTPVMLAVGFSYQASRYVVEVAPVSLNLGRFDVIGTTHLFNIIVGRIEASKAYKTTVQFSEGRKIVTIRDSDVKIILCPDRGIIFEGNQECINMILSMVQETVQRELERCTVS